MLRFLHLDEANHSEIVVVLQDYFGAVSADPMTCQFYKSDLAQALTIKFNKEGMIAAAFANNSITDGEIAAFSSRIEEDLLRNQTSKIGQFVGFCWYNKVDGLFAFKDLFRIVPVPENAPSPNQLVAPFPFLLQAKYTSSPNASVDYKRRRNIATLYIHLLNVLLEPQFALQGSGYTRFAWVLAKDFKDNSEFRQEGYYFPELSATIDSYSLPGNPMKEVPVKEYYGSPSLEHKLVVPDNLESSLELALNLPQEDKRRFCRSCNWIFQAQNSWHYSRSLSFIAHVNAVESLIVNPDNAVCPCCNKPKTSSVKLFKNFLDENVPERGLDKKTRDKIYWYRSQINHGFHLLESDISLIPRLANEEEDLCSELHMIVKRAVRNWLWKHDVDRANGVRG